MPKGKPVKRVLARSTAKLYRIDHRQEEDPIKDKEKEAQTDSLNSEDVDQVSGGIQAGSWNPSTGFDQFGNLIICGDFGSRRVIQPGGTVVSSSEEKPKQQHRF